MLRIFSLFIHMRCLLIHISLVIELTLTNAVTLAFAVKIELTSDVAVLL